MSAVWLAEVRSALQQLERPDPDHVDPRWTDAAPLSRDTPTPTALAALTGEPLDLLLPRLGRSSGWPATPREPGPNVEGELELPAIPDDPQERLLAASTFQGWPKYYKLAVQQELVPKLDEKLGNFLGLYAWGANDPISKDPTRRITRSRASMTALADVLVSAERLERQPLHDGMRRWLEALHEAALTRLAEKLTDEANCAWAPSSERALTQLWSALRDDHDEALAAAAVHPDDDGGTMLEASTALREFAYAFVAHAEEAADADRVRATGAAALQALAELRVRMTRSVRYRARVLELEWIVKDRLAALDRGPLPAWTAPPEPDHLTAEGWRSLEAGWLAEARFSTRDLRASTSHALAELQAARAAFLEAVGDPVTVRGLEKLEAAPPLARMQGAARLATPGIAALASYATDPALAGFLRALAEQAHALATPPEPAPTEVKIGVM